MAFEGSCHCGAVAFRVTEDVPTEAMSCNCSHCRRKGFLLSFVSSSAFSILSGADNLTDYHFNKHDVAHRFCSTCGCQPFGSGKGPTGAEMAAINLRCVPSIDLDSLTIQKVDGASF
ncbi:GFA family protein [Sphingobium sp. BYY-5]|uniref:GFA family protein n=1 Tax=Sphingobium sp. BYY-5 TaxID=2926400 RepID=UPI001FA7ADE6|nr:GFA family protein [Sphingobium sp. BYY-5]MCI4588954.1 GFA family protein [Sphingobium sp. BYY-5]